MKIRFLFLFCMMFLLLLCACNAPSQDDLSAFDDAPIASGSNTFYPVWDEASIYYADDIVIHNGQYFQALWWTQGTVPTEEAKGDEWIHIGAAPEKQYQYFPDVHDDAWYAEAINALAADSILTAVDGTANFFPSRPISRAEFAVFFCNAMDLTPTESGANFSDAGDSWYTPYLAALKQAGLSPDGNNEVFFPESYMTRQEICKLIYDACDGFAEDPATSFAAYTDSDSVATWAIQPVAWCIDRKIIKGNGNRLYPERSVSRAEAAHILYTLLSRK